MNGNETPDMGMIRGMVEDFWRSFITLSHQNPNAVADSIRRFDQQIAATASLMTQEKADLFLAAIDGERERLFVEYKRDPAALKRRLSIPSNRNQQPSSYQRQGIGEMAVRTAVRATIWQIIGSLFRR